MRAAVLAALCALAAVSGVASGAPATHTVTMDGMRFEPKDLTVAKGDVVTWVNKDVVPHTATSKAGGFDSKRVAAGRTWSYTAAQKGDFAYVCTLHGAMRGALHVR